MGLMIAWIFISLEFEIFLDPPKSEIWDAVVWYYIVLYMHRFDEGSSRWAQEVPCWFGLGTRRGKCKFCSSFHQVLYQFFVLNGEICYYNWVSYGHDN